MDYVGCYDVSHNIKMQVTENALQCAFLRVCESKIDISQNIDKILYRTNDLINVYVLYGLKTICKCSQRMSVL